MVEPQSNAELKRQMSAFLDSKIIDEIFPDLTSSSPTIKLSRLQSRIAAYLILERFGRLSSRPAPLREPED